MATGFGTPSITTPRLAALGDADSRSFQQTVNNIRERFATLEAATVALQGLSAGNTSAKDIQKLQQQVGDLIKKVASLNVSADIAEVASLLSQGNGFVVLKDGHLIVRVLQPGTGIAIVNADGSVGDPIISIGSFGSDTLIDSSGGIAELFMLPAGANDDSWWMTP